MSNWFTRIFKKDEKYERPIPSGVIIINEIAKEKGLNGEELKWIEFNDGRPSIKYCQEEVDVLREQGIPVLPEEYSDDFKFLEAEDEGGITTYRR